MYKKPENRIDSWHDLERFGIEVLTGEACGLSIRLLCDLSPQGASLIEEFLSVKLTGDNNSWNHRGQGGWKSILLPRGILEELAVFCLAKDGYRSIVYVDWKTDHAWAHYVVGLVEGEYEEWREQHDEIYKGQWRVFFNAGTAGLRNRHFMSGRVQ